MDEANARAGDETYLLLDEVRARIPTNPHRATLDRWIRLGVFPAPVRLGLRRLGWRKADIDAWLEGRRSAA